MEAETLPARGSVQKLLNEKEVSQIYGVSIAWLRKKRHQKIGPPFLKIGRMIFYRLQDLENFFNSHLVVNAGEPK